MSQVANSASQPCDLDRLGIWSPSEVDHRTIMPVLRIHKCAKVVLNNTTISVLLPQPAKDLFPELALHSVALHIGVTPGRCGAPTVVRFAAGSRPVMETSRASAPLRNNLCQLNGAPQSGPRSGISSRQFRGWLPCRNRAVEAASRFPGRPSYRTSPVANASGFGAIIAPHEASPTIVAAAPWAPAFSLFRS